MDRFRRHLMSTFFTTGLMGFVARQAFACSFDGIFDGSIGYVHPRSVEVALAVREAVADGALGEQALAPGQLNAFGLWRATEQLNQFGSRISAVGVEAMENRNIAKARLLYDFIDASDFYENRVAVDCRSRMNVPFFLRDERRNGGTH